MYNWFDQEYADFMIQVFSMIEPRFEEKGSIILDDFAEAQELLFVG
jgi:hypothetical protein